jgi:hypothetical protein
MRKLGIIAVLSLLVVALAAVPAIAANPHFVKGPTFTDNGTSLSASGSVAGLGNGDVTVILTAEGTADLVCENPAGHRAPGQDQTIEASGSQSINNPKNGRINFNVTTKSVQLSGTPKQRGCPNNKWEAIVSNVTFTSATLEIIQGGKVVLEETFTP